MTNELVVNGSIYASGQKGTLENLTVNSVTYQVFSGGGAGGTIWLQYSNLTGTGVILA